MQLIMIISGRIKKRRCAVQEPKKFNSSTCCLHVVSVLSEKHMTTMMTVISLYIASLTSRYKIFLSAHGTVSRISTSLLGSKF